MDFASTGQLVTACIRPGSNITTILDLKTGRELVRLGHRGYAVFSPTGEVFATIKEEPRSVDVVRDAHGNVFVEKSRSGARAFGGAELWETCTGRKLGELSHDAIIELQFAPNGKILASFASGSIKLWQISELMRDATK